MVEHRAPSRSNSSGANTMVDDEEKASPAASTVGYQDQAGTSKLPESCSKAGRQHSHSTSTVNTRESSQGRAAGSEKPDARAEKGADLEAGSPQWTIVDWDGPADPANPQNWSIRKKWSATTIVSLFTFMSPLASTFISPATPQLQDDFGVQNRVVLEMMTSIFLLAYALGPLALGPMSEIFGRVRVLQLANLFFMIFNFVTAWAPNTTAFIIFRFLAGFGGSAPLSIGGGLIGDVWRKEERGKAVAIYSLCPLLAPTFGPLLGSLIAEYSTWQWVFWSTTIFMVIIQVMGFFFLKETYAPVLLERKAAQLRASSGSKYFKSKFATGDRHWQAIVRKGLIRPFYLFAHEPIIQVFALVQMLVYGQIYLILVTVGTTFTGIYGWKQSVAGCVYLALGVGITGMSQGQGRTMDKVYKYFSDKRNGGKGKPEYRLIFLFPAGTLLPAGYLLYGLPAEHRVFWLVPCIGLAFIGAGMIGFFQPTQLYIIDCYALHAASALAAVTCLRSLCGFAFPLFAHQMFDTLGLGGGTGLLAGLSFLIGVPVPFILWRYGERIRLASKHAQA